MEFETWVARLQEKAKRSYEKARVAYDMISKVKSIPLISTPEQLLYLSFLIEKKRKEK